MHSYYIPGPVPGALCELTEISKRNHVGVDIVISSLPLRRKMSKELGV